MNVTPIGFFSVFHITILVTVQILTVVLLALLHLFPTPALVIIGCVMVMLTTTVIRMVSYTRRRFPVICGGVLSVCTTALCLAGCTGALILGGTLSTLFAAPQPHTAPAVTPNQPAPKAFTMYLSGSDTRGSQLTKSRSDLNIIAAVNPAAKQVLLVNTPRDYYVSNPAGGGAKDKLAHCGLYGTDNSREALSELYDLPIDYVAQINFKGFETLIDALGGVTIYSDTAFTTTEGGYAIAQGENVLNGAKALAFARERSHLSGGDVSRGENQMLLITALIQQASPTNLLAHWSDILSSLEGMFTTDMPLPTAMALVTAQLGDFRDWEIFSYSVIGTDGTDYNYSSGSKAYVMYPDSSSVNHARALLKQTIDGPPITREDVE